MWCLFHSRVKKAARRAPARFTSRGLVIVCPALANVLNVGRRRRSKFFLTRFVKIEEYLCATKDGTSRSGWGS